MSKKTLMVLIVVLAALCAALVMTGERQSGARAPAAAEHLLSGVDLSTVRSVTLADNTATTRLAQAEGVWTVAEQENYAADLDRLRELLRALDEAEGGEIVETDAARLAEYGLAADSDPAPLRLTLEHAAGTTVVALGKTREPRRSEDMWGPPPGRFVRVDEGPVRLLKDDPGVPAAAAQWWDRQLLAVPPAEVRKVEIAEGDDSFILEKDTNDVIQLAGMAEGEQLESAAAERLFAALRALTADALLPAAEAADKEGDFANATRFQAAANGLTYMLQVGEPPAEPDGRLVKLEVAAGSEAPPEQQAAAAALTKKFAGRVFRVPAYLAEALIMKRDAVVKKSEPPPPPPEATAAPAAQPEAAPEAPAEAVPPPVPEAGTN